MFLGGEGDTFTLPWTSFKRAVKTRMQLSALSDIRGDICIGILTTCEKDSDVSLLVYFPARLETLLTTKRSISWWNSEIEAIGAF